MCVRMGTQAVFCCVLSPYPHVLTSSTFSYMSPFLQSPPHLHLLVPLIPSTPPPSFSSTQPNSSFPSPPHHLSSSPHTFTSLLPFSPPLLHSPLSSPPCTPPLLSTHLHFLLLLSSPHTSTLPHRQAEGTLPARGGESSATEGGGASRGGAPGRGGQAQGQRRPGGRVPRTQQQQQQAPQQGVHALPPAILTAHQEEEAHAPLSWYMARACVLDLCF